MTGSMKAAKVTISINSDLLRSVDLLVSSHEFASRSEVVQKAVQEKIARLRKSRLERECAKLDPATEQRHADEGLALELDQWPEY